MKDNFHDRGHKATRSDILCPPCLCALCVKYSLVFILMIYVSLSAVAQNETSQTQSEPRTRYQLQIAIDFEKRSYTGTERVRFVNRGEHAVSVLFFHLYPNIRVPGYAPPKAGAGQPLSDEPRLELTGVRLFKDGA